MKTASLVAARGLPGGVYIGRSGPPGPAGWSGPTSSWFNPWTGRSWPPSPDLRRVAEDLRRDLDRLDVVRVWTQLHALVANLEPVLVTDAAAGPDYVLRRMAGEWFERQLNSTSVSELGGPTVPLDELLGVDPWA